MTSKPSNGAPAGAASESPAQAPTDEARALTPSATSTGAPSTSPAGGHDPGCADRLSRPGHPGRLVRLGRLRRRDCPGRPRRRGRWAGVVGWELLRVLLWLPTVFLLIPTVLLFHLTVPMGAALERIIARRLGTDAPSGRRRGERKVPWLLARVAHADFWRQDLPLCLGGLTMTTASFLLGSSFGSLTAVSLLAPFVASSDDPITVTLGGPTVTVTNAADSWFMVPIGMVFLTLTAATLLGVGTLRLRMVSALSGDRDAQRVQRLTAEVGHLTASRATLMDAFEAERARIERDLHDGAQQGLVALAMSLGGLRLAAESLPDEGATAATRAMLLEGVDGAQDRAEAALRDLRETVRGIRPAILSERGLAPALRDLAGRTPLPAAVIVDAEKADLDAISPPVATVVYFAVAEALTNAAKHARAGGATVTLRCAGAELSAVVADDGCGGADPGREDATGLRGMAQRVESIGGHLEVDSPAGGGTRLSITAPLTPPWGADAQEDEREAGPAGASQGAADRPGALTPEAASATSRSERRRFPWGRWTRRPRQGQEGQPGASTTSTAGTGRTDTDAAAMMNTD